MFADLDESIRLLLVEQGNLNSGEIDISFDMPTREWAGSISKPTVNLYLYDVRENSQKRNPTPWTIRKGATAVKAAGTIHTDFEKKFIRAEVIQWEKLLERDGYAGARQHGELRLEGKEYVVEDGDVLVIRHG